MLEREKRLHIIFLTEIGHFLKRTGLMKHLWKWILLNSWFGSLISSFSHQYFNFLNLVYDLPLKFRVCGISWWLIKTWPFHCQGPRFNPWLGNQDPTSHVVWTEKTSQAAVDHASVSVVRRDHPPVSHGSVIRARRHWAEAQWSD